MNGGHISILDAILIIDNLSSRCEAVGCTTGVRDNMMICWVILVFINTENDGQIFALSRCADDNLLSASFDVF